MEKSNYHIPVLLNECIQALQIRPNGVYVDATFGGGGHARAILQQLDQNGHLFAFDQDEDATRNLIDDDRFTFIAQNFAYIKRFLKIYQQSKVDGILADLGVSSHQFDTAERGFSLRFEEAALDMRMSSSNDLTARDVLNTYGEAQLADIFYYYGELRQARQIARTIIAERQIRPLATVKHLKQLTSPYVKGKPHKFYAQLFQALRIEVNGELEVLKTFLEKCTHLLKPKGRLVVIAYHSIEDRLIKNFLKKGSFDGIEEKDLYGNVQKPFTAINKKVIVPSEDEIRQNSRARSARLRIAEKRLS